MSNKTSIYANCNPQLTKLFDSAGHPAKVMCVALDYAKQQHTALICNGCGEVLKSAFALENSRPGLKELLAHVKTVAKGRRIRSEHVFFGGEDCPSFAESFVRELRQAQFLVVGVNAWEAKQQRDNFQASTDSLDLMSIARCCLKRRGESLVDVPAAYANLRISTRDRDQLVRLCTATSNRIHSYVDRLFPGFLDPAKSGLSPFNQAGLELMSQQFSAQQIAKRSTPSLTQWLSRHRVKEPKTVAQQLKTLARNATSPDPQQAAVMQRTLSHLVELYQGFQKSIASMNRELAFWLARTPGALLTSIGGLGITLAAGWTAELGPPSRWRSIDKLCSYAGVVPRTEQTGGPSKAPVTLAVQQRCNKRLKNVVLQSVEKVLLFGPEDLRTQALELEARGAHTNFAIAKRLARICKYLVCNSAVYVPKALLTGDTPKDVVAQYYQLLWPKLIEKWRDKANLQDVFASPHPLGQWRDMVQSLYALELRLPRQVLPASAP